jgi:hypothetical protein
MRGANPGERRGGRVKGTPNKRTAAREAMAEQIARETGMPRAQVSDGLRRAAAAARQAKDEIEHTLIPMVRGVLAHIQQRIIVVDENGAPVLGEDGKPQINPAASLAEYKAWMEFFADLHVKLMPFQSPRFGVLAVGYASSFAGTPALDAREVLELPSPDKVRKLDPNAAADAYFRVVKGGARPA